jgi:hypothetical protein
MDDTLDQMAANIVAQMRRVEVERELLPGLPAPRENPAPWRAGPWAREHTTQAALLATVALGWLARLLRRGRRRHRGRSWD